MVKGFIVDRKKSKLENGQPVIWYTMIIENGIDEKGRIKYTDPIADIDENIVKYVLSNQIDLVNATIKDGKIVTKDASLARFNQDGYRVKPYTVCAEIRSDKDVLLGYKVASWRNGRVVAVTNEKFIEVCEKLMVDALSSATNPKELFKPVQNMKFSPKYSDVLNYAGSISEAMKEKFLRLCAMSGVDSQDKSDSFLSIYSTNNPLPVEIWEVKANKYAHEAKPTQEMKANAVKVDAKDALSMFTDEQKRVLINAKARGVDITTIANPKIDAAKMKILADLEADGFQGRILADPDWTIEKLDYLNAMMRCKVDVKPVLNTQYTTMQMNIILAGIMKGLDVNSYADPSFPYDVMAEKYRDLLDKSWCDDIKIMEGTKYVSRTAIKK